MCQMRNGESVRLHVWFQAPFRREVKRPDLIGGHVALEVKKGERTVYLGWWPRFWTVFRKESTGIVRQMTKGPRWIYQKLVPHKGKTTKAASGAAASSTLSADEIDSVLVWNRRLADTLFQAPHPPWTERPPDETIDICVPDLDSLIQYIDDFNEKGKVRSTLYHFILNNCATVSMAALKAGGVKTSFYKFWRLGIWSPRFSYEFCCDKLTCSSQPSC